MSDPKQPETPGASPHKWETVNGGADLSRIMTTLQRIRQTAKSPPPPPPPPSGPAQK